MLFKSLPTLVTSLIIAYFVFKGLDIILGLVKAWKNDCYKSRIMRDGICRAISEVVALVFVITIDILLGANYVLCSATAALFIFKEGGSIIENLGEMGVTLPAAVQQKFAVFNTEKSLEETAENLLKK